MWDAINTLFAWRLAACGDELVVVRGLRLARRTPFWSATLFVCAAGQAAMHYVTHMTDLQPARVLRPRSRRHGGSGASCFNRGAVSNRRFAERADEGMAYRQPALPLGNCVQSQRDSFLWFLAFCLAPSQCCSASLKRRSPEAHGGFEWAFGVSLVRPASATRAVLALASAGRQSVGLAFGAGSSR
jgi:hypothetical protein